MALDVDFARSQFPTLAGRMVFMDNAGGSQCLATVADRVRDFLLTTNVQTGASYATSIATTNRVAEARKAMMRLVNAREPAEMIMGTNSSTMMKFLAEGLASSIRPGDEIIVTSADHASHISPFLKLKERGAVIKWWRFDQESFDLSMDDLDALLSDRTRLVAMTHCSNILGGITDVKEAAKRAHAAGSEIAIDGVAYAPHRRIDVQELDVDYYFLSLYKVYGPHQALMYGRKSCLAKLDNLYQYFMGPDDLPNKLEPGNCNYELAWGSAAILNYLDILGLGHADPIKGAFEVITAHESQLARQLVEGLRQFKGVRLIGPEPDSNARGRVPTISFVHDSKPSPEIVEHVDTCDIGIRHGDFYARDVVEDLKLRPKGGVVRVSLAHYNTPQEVDRLLQALAGVI